MIALLDSNSNRVISIHRTVKAAERADEKFQVKVERANGGGAYVRTKLVDGKGLKKGMWISQDEIKSLSRVSNSWEVD